MAAVSCVLSEDQFLCSICLEVFTDPVTTPCGHSFCKSCINKHWDNSTHCHCPVCQEDFSTRPLLKLNTCLSEMVCQFKNTPQGADSLEPQAAEPRDVSCDVCSEPRLKALKSCLVCLASYCQSHLEPHITIPRLKRHQLIDPVENLEDRICSEHDKPLELFCRHDSQFICLQCIYEEHVNHDTVPLKRECEIKQAKLREVIKEQLLKLEEVQHLVELSQKNADREMEKGIKVFTELIECIHQSLDKFKKDIQERHKKTEEQAAELLEKIQKEIYELEQTRAEMEELWGSEDHLHFLRTFTSVKLAPSVNDWTKGTVRAPSYEGRVAKAVSELENTLLNPNIIKHFEAKWKLVQEHAVDVTLDPNTAHPNLVVSDDLKQVHHTDQSQNVPDKPNRFATKLYVLGKQKFSSGRFYFEVEVKGKTSWYVGVAKESIDRKVKISPTPQDGYWFIFRNSNNQYLSNTSPLVMLSPKSCPEKVGVYVDYEEGLVSFYNVDTAELIYSFSNCCFTDKLLPLVCPGNNKNGKNSAPLILTPVTFSFLKTNFLI